MVNRGLLEAPVAASPQSMLVFVKDLVLKTKIMKTSQTIRRGLADRCNRYGVEIVYVFGSRAEELKEILNGKAKSPASDLSDADIGVKLRPASSLSVREKVRLSAELEDLLGVNRVDLCVLEEADPFLAADVVRGERLYCEDEYRADEYDLYVLRRAGDLAPLERERLGFVFADSKESV